MQASGVRKNFNQRRVSHQPRPRSSSEVRKKVERSNEQAEEEPWDPIRRQQPSSFPEKGIATAQAGTTKVIRRFFEDPDPEEAGGG
jgi:hypothetical protein